MSSDQVAKEPQILLTAEQEDLASVLKQAFGDWTRARLDSGELEPSHDPEHWRSLAQDLGLLGVDIPVEHGGEGYSAVELGLTMTEMGKVLLSSPFLSTVVLSAGLLMAVEDDEAAADFLPRIAAGELQAAVAVDESGHGWSPVDIGTVAESQADGGYRLSGTKRNVVDGSTAGVIFVAARHRDGVGFFAVDGDDPRMQRSEIETMDATRRLTDLRLEGATGRPIGSTDAAWVALDAVRDRLYACLACEQVGAARASLEMVVDYAKSRRQFNRPIGSFQAIKHACANLYVEIEAAESLARYAIACLATDDAETKSAAPLAAAAAVEALDHAASANIQFHGGIGFTWEHPAHRYYRRATASRLLFGSPGEFRRRAFEYIDDTGGGAQ
jgi:alkylation response protein AidB-like acyl-CoA dehydrogenase